MMKKASKQIFIVVAMLTGLAFSLITAACAELPGQDAPCTGSRRNDEWCAQQGDLIKDTKFEMPWYVEWAMNVNRTVLLEVGSFTGQAGVTLFWSIYKDAASTDFTGPSTGNCNSQTVTANCVAVQASERSKSIAFAFIGLIFAWLFVKVILNGFVNVWKADAAATVLKTIIAVLAISYQAELITALFGVSNLMFETLLGNPTNLTDLTKNLIGNEQTGLGSLNKVNNIGLLLICVFVCFLLAIVFITLAIAFFIRSVLIIIHFVLAPLAFLASTTEEFSPWFHRWLQNIQGLLVAPLPVAVALGLIQIYGGTIPSAHDKPTEFLLSLLYIIAFLAVSSVMMLKMTGGVALNVMGAATAGLGMLGNIGAAATSNLGEIKFGFGRKNSSKTGDSVNADAANNKDKKEGSSGNLLPAGSTSDALALPASNSAANGTLAGGVSAPALSTAASFASQPDEQLNRLLRGLTESFSQFQQGGPAAFNFQPRDVAPQPRPLLETPPPAPTAPAGYSAPADSYTDAPPQSAAPQFEAGLFDYETNSGSTQPKPAPAPAAPLMSPAAPMPANQQRRPAAAPAPVGAEFPEYLVLGSSGSRRAARPTMPEIEQMPIKQLPPSKVHKNKIEIIDAIPDPFISKV